MSKKKRTSKKTKKTKKTRSGSSLQKRTRLSKGKHQSKKRTQKSALKKKTAKNTKQKAAPAIRIRGIASRDIRESSPHITSRPSGDAAIIFQPDYESPFTTKKPTEEEVR